MSALQDGPPLEGATAPEAGSSGARLSSPLRAGRFDHAARRRAQRRGRERGCWVYISAEDLERAGVPLDAPPPDYRTWAASGRPRVVVNLYPVPA